MSPLKFRAWNSINQIMSSDGIFFNNSEGTLKHDPAVIVMQSTGLKDKNGKEIFEGDILKRSKEAVRIFVAVIEFKRGMFGGATYPHRNHWLPMNKLDCCDMDGDGYDEIIGNIFQNSELLPS